MRVKKKVSIVARAAALQPNGSPSRCIAAYRHVGPGEGAGRVESQDLVASRRQRLDEERKLLGQLALVHVEHKLGQARPVPYALLFHDRWSEPPSPGGSASQRDDGCLREHAAVAAVASDVHKRESRRLAPMPSSRCWDGWNCEWLWHCKPVCGDVAYRKIGHHVAHRLEAGEKGCAGMSEVFAAAARR